MNQLKKVCNKCKVEKTLDHFYKVRGKYNRGQTCKACHSIIGKERRMKKKLEAIPCKIKGCKNIAAETKGLCNAHYLRLKRFGRLHKTNSNGDPIEINFDGDCYEVVNRKPNKQGYPQVQHKGRPCTAHRKFYEELFGDVPKGLVIRHKCDNRLCVNPEHLELGTHKDNSQDMVKRNRQCKGEKSKSSKLKEHQVVEIKKMLRKVDGNLMAVCKRLAIKYNVGVSTILDIYYNKTWKHVEIELKCGG